VTGYIRTEKKKKKSIDIRQELNTFNIGEKATEYKWNYLEHILRMSTNQIPWKLFDCYSKGREGSATKEMDHFIYSNEQNKSKGLNLAADDILYTKTGSENPFL
jgi:hypothetical protein